MSDNVFVSVKDLHKAYGEGGSYAQVLKGVSIKINKGEMCVIQGTSGSGKSTLLIGCSYAIPTSFRDTIRKSKASSADTCSDTTSGHMLFTI